MDKFEQCALTNTKGCHDDMKQTKEDEQIIIT